MVQNQHIRRSASTVNTAEAGFTIIELMIAIMVLVVGIVAVLQSFVAINSLRSSADQRTQVQTHSATIMDEIYQADIAGLTTYVPPAFVGGPDVDVAIAFIDENGDSVTPPLEDGVVLPNPVIVSITMTSTYTSGREVTTVSSAVARR
ncbi:MAG: prepilin-type N-terminal cleavage/methylation domain-containing protein [Candidatus Hydrogenedentota bacterium]